jgi:hypothetical protein
MRERLRFEREIQDLGLEANTLYKEYYSGFNANDIAGQLIPIFLAKFSFKRAGRVSLYPMARNWVRPLRLKRYQIRALRMPGKIR